MQTYQQQPSPSQSFIHQITSNHPQALAWVRGGSAYPGISGLVKFYDTPYAGIVVEAEVFGLPNITEPGSSDFYAMHIHEYGDCTDHFAHAGGHYNPKNALHPQHAGDLPPLLSSQGYAWSAFYDKRFQVDDIIGRSVIIHANRDDFTSQPSGDSGQMIACGAIYPE